MRKEKMNFANLQKLSRAEMRSVMAGRVVKVKGDDDTLGCISADSCAQGCMELERGTANGICSGCCIV